MTISHYLIPTKMEISFPHKTILTSNMKMESKPKNGISTNETEEKHLSFLNTKLLLICFMM